MEIKAILSILHWGKINSIANKANMGACIFHWNLFKKTVLDLWGLHYKDKKRKSLILKYVRKF